MLPPMKMRDFYFCPLGVISVCVSAAAQKQENCHKTAACCHIVVMLIDILLIQT